MFERSGMSLRGGGRFGKEGKVSEWRGTCSKGGGERKGAGERRAGLLREGGAFDNRRRFLRGRGVPFKGSGSMSGVMLIFPGGGGS